MRAAGFVAVVVAAVIVSLGPVPASLACSCARQSSISQTVDAADAVYIGIPEVPGDVSSEHFQIVRVLKGPMLRFATVQVPGRGVNYVTDCAASVWDDTYVLTKAAGSFAPISDCSGNLHGATAVAEAKSALGPGRLVLVSPEQALPARTGWIIVVAVAAVALLIGYVLGHRRSRPHA